ncbi:DNRLRE domain-containing protein [Panacibacter sp. DH6]|uniref:DNRLRE domain-containing protein n=1 Tax=Panacibacter microcysteis TaxID=2793269 RepID=A0A931E5M2_9BACT|nr:DNRLRE domain-containing protein [Panacibacter microcysteis]MBG9377493.1 DNRLRE domain-containing protein [Panacibacter microcysteis]
MLNRKHLLLAVCYLCMISCKKENTPISTSSGLQQNDASVISSADAPGLYRNTRTGEIKLVLQPGDDGQDALIQWKQDDDANANSNAGQLPELDGFAWTVYGTPVLGRSLIKFTGLNDIPDSAKILGAKLFLYGTTSSAPAPQGNSSYPGSPYGEGNNSCYIKRVTSDWDENTVTWNTRPSVTSKDMVVTEASTSQWNFNTSVDVTALVKPMVKADGLNNGFEMVLAGETLYKSIIFSASEAAIAHKRPKLIIVYKL